MNWITASCLMLLQELNSFGVSNMFEIVSHLVTYYISHSFLALLKAAFISFFNGTRRLQCALFRVWKKRVDNFTLGEGVLPASFKVLYDYDQEKETLLVDFGASAMEEWRLLIQHYWLDFTQLKNIYRYKTEYSHTTVNKFNVIPESIPDWVFDFMPLRGGYLIGNVSPARMDFRWFLVGNCIAILSSLVTPAQGHEWRIVTGFDPKNTSWSYHNGGSWPSE
ncbi:hypothetical protein Peur_022299 [Populus x canadensis]